MEGVLMLRFKIIVYKDNLVTDILKTDSKLTINQLVKTAKDKGADLVEVYERSLGLERKIYES